MSRDSTLNLLVPQKVEHIKMDVEMTHELNGITLHLSGIRSLHHICSVLNLIGLSCVLMCGK